jgi:5-methylcytosine-specific restriction protein A
VGVEEFEKIQDMWAESGKRVRWSVAFPVIESFEIFGAPLAAEVFSRQAMTRIFAHPSATLRLLSDVDRLTIAELEIVPKATANAWIGIADEIAMAEGSGIDPKTHEWMDEDLARGAVEGISAEQWKKVRLRAAWLADKFVRKRVSDGTLVCDACGYDPVVRVGASRVNPRSLLDVHHKRPLDEGKRYTTLEDFTLLCPNCHRLEHELQRSLAAVL